jgi:hypothetical protein
VPHSLRLLPVPCGGLNACVRLVFCFVLCWLCGVLCASVLCPFDSFFQIEFLWACPSFSDHRQSGAGSPGTPWAWGTWWLLGPRAILLLELVLALGQ